MARLAVLAAIAAAAVAATAAATNATGSGSPPNVVILWADDLGWGDLSCYGHPTTNTPNVDRLATEGVRMTQFYTGHPLCTPSRAALMTGRYASRFGLACGWTGGVLMADSTLGLPANETTLPEMLKTAPTPYRTGMIGKWHLGQLPQYLPSNHGFDQYHGIPYSIDMGYSSARMPSGPNDPGSDDEPVPLPLITQTSAAPSSYDILAQPPNLDTLTSNYTQWALDFISSSSGSGSPFFLYMSYQHVHTPNFCAPDICGTSPRGLFGDALEELDRSVGQIMDAIRGNAAIASNTLVVFASDNGPWFEEQNINGGSAGLLYEGKASTWEGGVRVPGIFWWPGRIAPARSIEVASTLDVFPTLAAITGAKLPAGTVLDGKDISSLIFNTSGSSNAARGAAAGRPRTASAKTGRASLPAISATGNTSYFYYRGGPQYVNRTLQPGLWATRLGPYKAHFVTKSGYGKDAPVFHNPPLLFDVEVDPSERWPLNSTDPQYAGILAAIAEVTAAHKATWDNPAPPSLCSATDRSAAICCDPNSQKKYPQWPKCTCNPENF